MATLELEILGLQPPTASEAERKKTLSSQIKRLMSKSGGNSGPIEYEVNWNAYLQFTTIRDFLQPKTSISLEDCVDRIVDSFSDGYSNLRAFNSICLELAEQIPYHHPAHIKLARLLYTIGRNEKCITKSHLKDTQALQAFYQDLSEDLHDDRGDPRDEDSDPMAYVNYEAFLAHLMEVGVYTPGAGLAMYAMRMATEESSEKDSNAIKEVWALGSAQWILWYGQGLLKLLLCPAEKDNEKATSFDLEMWSTWKAYFENASDNDEFGQECRTVVKRAVEMMITLEKCM